MVRELTLMHDVRPPATQSGTPRRSAARRRGVSARVPRHNRDATRVVRVAIVALLLTITRLPFSDRFRKCLVVLNQNPRLCLALVSVLSPTQEEIDRGGSV